MMEIKDGIDLFLQYLLVEKGLSKLTIESYRTDLEKFFEFYPSKKYIEELEPGDLQSFLNEQRREDRKDATISRRASSIKHFFAFLKKEGIYKDELPEIETFKKASTLPNCLTIEEVEDLLNAPNMNTPSGIRMKR